MIKGVIFDMDGVLIDSEPIHKKTFLQYLKELDVNLTPADHDAFIGTTNRQIFARLKEQYSLADSIATLVEGYEQRYMAALQAENVDAPIPGVLELVAGLKHEGHKMAVASSSPRQHIDLILEMLGLSSFFVASVSGNEVTHSKPAPDIFLRASSLLGLSPKECLVIEDSYNGVTAAKAAGMACIGLQNPNSGQQDLSQADRIISVYGELRGELGEWLSGGR